MMTCWFWKCARYPGEEFHEIVRVKTQGRRQELQKLEFHNVNDTEEMKTDW